MHEEVDGAITSKGRTRKAPGALRRPKPLKVPLARRAPQGAATNAGGHAAWRPQRDSKAIPSLPWFRSILLSAVESATYSEAEGHHEELLGAANTDSSRTKAGQQDLRPCTSFVTSRPPSEYAFSMNEETVRAEIQTGEGSTCEFKSSLRWNIHAKKNDQALTLAVMRAVAGFLNTSGGVVLIGVADDGRIPGIGPDGYRNDDQFLVALFTFIKTALGEDVASLVEAETVPVNGNMICRVECMKSAKPVFLTFADENDSFFIRTGPVTSKLPGSKIHLYINEHWKKEDPSGRPRVTLQYVAPTKETSGALVFHNVGETAAFNLQVAINVYDTNLTLQLGPIAQLESQKRVEHKPDTFFDGDHLFKGGYDGDFRNLLKWIYVQKWATEQRAKGTDDDVIRDYGRRAHTTTFDVIYTDFEGRTYTTPHRLTYDPSKHSVLIQLDEERAAPVVAR
ncbi:MAG: AlbA family DNA-binding domain-containing protein [Thermoanaerobaculia bacterium]